MRVRRKTDDLKHFTSSIEDFYATRRLKKLGITDEQLSLCRFLTKNGRDFDEWSFTWNPSLPKAIERAAIPFFKPYLTYRWVTEDAPSGHSSLCDAWRELAEIEAGSYTQIGLRYKEDQREKGARKRKRNYILSLEITMAQLVEQFSKELDIRELSYAESWHPFFAYLDSKDLDPKEKDDSYEYNAGRDKRRLISFTQFKRLMRLARAILCR